MSATPEQQGILSVLVTDCKTGKDNSLRKTLSADVSSRKWSAENGSSVIDSSSYSQHEVEEQNEQKRVPEDQSRASSCWSFLLAQKPELEEPTKSSPLLPYVHPLVKRSASSLSSKSLEVCTESLCSETGYFKFSSSPPLELENTIKEEVEDLVEKQDNPVQNSDIDKAWLDRCEVGTGTKRHSRNQSFPPPIPSLCYQQSGTSLHMNSRRNCGRLVLEAVSMSYANNFQAQREEGRLILAFADQTTDELGSKTEGGEEFGEESDEMVDELDEGFWDFVQNNEKEEEIGCDDEGEEHQKIETETRNGFISAEDFMQIKMKDPISVPRSLSPCPHANNTMASSPPAPAAPLCGYPMPPEVDEPLAGGNKRMCLESAPVFEGCGGPRSSVLFSGPHGMLTA